MTLSQTEMKQVVGYNATKMSKNENGIKMHHNSFGIIPIAHLIVTVSCATNLGVCEVPESWVQKYLHLIVRMTYNIHFTSSIVKSCLSVCNAITEFLKAQSRLTRNIWSHKDSRFSAVQQTCI